MVKFELAKMETKGVNSSYLLYSQIGKLFGISPTISDFSEGNTISATLSPKSEKMHEGDNPPVGILLRTRKGKKMVEYAIAGMDNNLFVSTCMLQLPDKATLEKFLHDEMQDMQ